MVERSYVDCFDILGSLNDKKNNNLNNLKIDNLFYYSELKYKNYWLILKLLGILKIIENVCCLRYP